MSSPNPILALFGRARQEWDASDKDTIPNPLAGAGVGPANVHFNPLSGVPVLGGLINRTANGPLHSVGLVNEAAGNVAQGVTGEGLLALALIMGASRAASGSEVEDTPAGRLADQIVAQGPLHPGRITDLVKHFDNPLMSMPAGAVEMLANPLNYAGPIGEAGRGIEAGAPLVGKSVQNLAKVLDATNRIQGLPLAITPRGRANLLPEIFGKVKTPAEEVLGSEAAREALSRPPLPPAPLPFPPRATVPDLPAPTPPVPVPPARPAPPLPFPGRPPQVAARAAEYVANRGAATPLGPPVAPRSTSAPIPLDLLAGVRPRATQAALPLNPVEALLQARLRPQAAVATPLERVPDLEGLAQQAQGTGLGVSTLPDPSTIIEAAFHTGDQAVTTAAPDLGAAGDETDWTSELLAGIEDAVRRGNVEEANALVASAPDFGVPVSRAQQVLNAAADAGGADLGATAQRAMIEESPYFQVFKHFNRDGTVKKVNPTTGAKLVLRDNGRIVKGADEVWNLPGSGYDEVAAAALDNAASGHNQNFGQTNDEFWRNAQAAYLEYQRLKQPGATMGGDLAAGGGGFGIVPARLGTTLGGAALGGAVGAGIGAATDEDDRLRGAAKGLGIGTLVGGNLGSAAPELVQAAQQIAPTVAAKFADDTLRNPEVWVDALAYGAKQQVDSLGSTGVKGTEAWGAFWRRWGSQAVLTLKQLPQDALTRLITMKGLVEREFGIGAPELEAAQGEARAVLMGRLKPEDDSVGRWITDLGLPQLHQVREDLVGATPAEALVGRGAEFKGPGRAISGALMGVASGARTLNPLAPLYGAARHYFAPFVEGAIVFLNTMQHNGFRHAMLDAGLNQAMPQVGDAFLQSLQGRGIDVGPLAGRGGRFSAQEVAQVAGKQAADDWAMLAETTLRKVGDRAATLAGDFRDKLDPKYSGTVTRGDKVLGTIEKGFGKVAPFSRWTIRYTPVLVELAARHPRAALLALGETAREGGEGITYDDQTPLIGLAARARNGGAAGTTSIKPLQSLIPYASLADTTKTETEDPTAYQRVTGALDKIGFGPNPAIQAGAYVTGQDFKAPGALSRTAALEALPDVLPPLARALLHTAGQHKLASQVPDMPQIPGGRALLDAGRQLLAPVTGASGASANTPEARRYAELVLAQTHKPLTDPSNRGYLETMGQSDNPLWQLALIQARTGAAVGNVTSMTSPFQVTGRTTEANAARQAPKLPYTGYQISQAPKAQQPAMLLANRRAIAQDNPASATYVNITGKAREEDLLARWDFDHQFLKKTAPALYVQRRKEYQASLR